jgi:hypothetical protein
MKDQVMKEKPTRQPHSFAELDETIVSGEASEPPIGDRPELGSREEDSDEE